MGPIKISFIFMNKGCEDESEISFQKFSTQELKFKKNFFQKISEKAYNC